VKFTEECQWRAAADSGSREEKVGRAFIGQQKAVAVFPCASRLRGRGKGRDKAGGGGYDGGRAVTNDGRWCAGQRVGVGRVAPA
jgi:hypothetical protein